MVANALNGAGLCKYNAAFSPQYGGGLCAALSTLALRLALHNKCQVMSAYAQLSCIDGKCANLKVTGGRDGKREESNE
jgi:hypothetical protein